MEEIMIGREMNSKEMIPEEVMRRSASSTFPIYLMQRSCRSLVLNAAKD